MTGYDQPIGISDYQLSKAVPENLKSALPSIEEVEEELASFLDNENKDIKQGHMAEKYRRRFPNTVNSTEYTVTILTVAFSFDKQKFISDFYQEYNDMKSFEAAILELVLDKQKNNTP